MSAGYLVVPDQRERDAVRARPAVERGVVVEEAAGVGCDHGHMPRQHIWQRPRRMRVQQEGLEPR
jgi:hypothetical protein